MIEHEVVCPSGLTGKIRPLIVEDEELTQDVKLLKSGKIIYELCNRCWVNTSDKGPYSFDTENPEWSEMLQGDAFWVFLQIRKVTYGDSYEFDYQCKSCGEVNNWEMFFSELYLQDLTEEAMQAFIEGSPISETTENGTSFTFKLLTGKDDRKINNYKEENKLSHARAALLTRLVAIDGMGKLPNEKLTWLKGLTSAAADELSEIMEYHDCGVDTEIEVICSKCGHEQEETLPLGVNFFRRKSTSKKRRRKRTKKG